MRNSPNLQQNFDNQPINQELIAKLDTFDIHPDFKQPLADYLQSIEATVEEILDPRVQQAIQIGSETFEKKENIIDYNEERHKRRNAVFIAANDNRLDKAA